MSYDPHLAEFRFGYGLSPTIAPPLSVEQMIQGLHGPDKMAERFPIETFPIFRKRMEERDRLQKAFRKKRGSDEGDVLRKQIRLVKKAAREDHLDWMAAQFLRSTYSETPFFERLQGFWADHFTVAGKAGVIRRGVSPYIETAIRPFMMGRFEQLLISAVTHPMMVHYLDQQRSAGPNSTVAVKKPGKWGLNENLAREILELHTLGVDGPYTQTDVRELAELLTGLTLQINQGRKFRKALAEPGAETVLGKTYGGDNPHMRDIEAVLRDLAVHPATARHMARKLVIHFVSDAPNAELVKALETVWLETGGELSKVYETLLKHPSAWDTEVSNFKQPFDFMCSSFRALAVSPAALQEQKENKLRQRLFFPMRLMGQIWQKPSGPDGLDEADNAWITPQSMAARLQWAVIAPRFFKRPLPDPRAFVETALGPRADDKVRFAASAAESRAEGIGLVLVSPAFQWR